MRRYFTIIYWGVLVPAVGIVLWVGARWVADGLQLGQETGRTPSVSAIVFLAWGALLLLAGVEWFVRTRLLGRTPAREFSTNRMQTKFPWFAEVRKKISKAETQISFISNRRKVTVDLAAIVYIESRDFQVLVWVATAAGAASDSVCRTERSELKQASSSEDRSRKFYPTRMKISQWEAALDDRFVRIHRSFIVSRAHITRIETQRVWLSSDPVAAEISVEISRKYRNNI